MMAMRNIVIALILGIAGGLLLLDEPAQAGREEREWEDDDYDHDRARRAVDRGEALPMAQLLERLRARVPGDVVGVKFEREDGRWVYEFKLVDDEGRLREVYMDAKSGEILSREHD